MALLDDDTFRRLCRARDLADASFRGPISLDALAREACLSPFHFHRLFTKAFGETPHEFLTSRRIGHAKRMLAGDHASITDICFEAGYSSLGSFSAKFQKSVGLSPSEYRRNVRRIVGYPGLSIFVPNCFFGFHLQ